MPGVGGPGAARVAWPGLPLKGLLCLVFDAHVAIRGWIRKMGSSAHRGLIKGMLASALGAVGLIAAIGPLHADVKLEEKSYGNFVCTAPYRRPMPTSSRATPPGFGTDRRRRYS
jgi:hypothetical protein